MNPTKVLVVLISVVVLLFAVVLGLHGGQATTGGGDPSSSRLAGLRERFVGKATLAAADVKGAPCLGADRKSFAVGAGKSCPIAIPGRVRKVVLKRVNGQSEIVVSNREKNDPKVPDNRAGKGNPVRLDVYDKGSTLVITCPSPGPSCTVAIGS